MAADRQILEKILVQLERIANALEASNASVNASADVARVSLKEILNLAPRALGDNRESFAKTIFDNMEKHPRAIAGILKEMGLLAKSTHWADVKALKRLSKD